MTNHKSHSKHSNHSNLPPTSETRTIRAIPDSLDSLDSFGGTVKRISLHGPPSPSSHVLGEDNSAHNNLLLTGSNVLDFVKHYRDSKDGGRFYFRGEQLYSTKLVPSLLREHNLPRLLKSWNRTNAADLEWDLLNRFKRYTWHTFHAESDFAGQQLNFIESLCVAQHNGLPTMLLDWSLNPFIALFFAARYQTRHIGLEKKLAPATVWVMKLRPPEDRSDMTIHLEANKGATDLDEQIKLRGDNTPLVVVPLSFTRRIDAQSGRFIYCRCLAKDQNAATDPSAPLPLLREWNRSPWVKIDQWIIPGDQRDDVLKQIRILGFHDGKMFPDLKGWANYLQAGHK